MDVILGIFCFLLICSLDIGVNVEVFSSKVYVNIRCEIFMKVIYNVNVLNDIVWYVNYECISVEVLYLVVVGYN